MFNVVAKLKTNKTEVRIFSLEASNDKLLVIAVLLSQDDSSTTFVFVR